MINPFFENTGPYTVNELFKSLGLNNDQNFNSEKITDIKDLNTSEKNNITFFHSKKYIELAKNTKASYCITSENLKSYLPKTCKSIISKNILLDTAKITKIFYPDSVSDNFDETVKIIENTEFKEKVNFGLNVLIGKNVKIGSNCLIGHNPI